jgi:hypothetical protein
MKLKDVYLPYLPAIMTLAGAVLIALGLWLGWWEPSAVAFQQLRFIGALLAVLGALWSAHNQVRGAAAAKERDQKIIELSEQLQGHITGGNSFCYGYPLGGFDQPTFRWIFSHEGQYPLTDVIVRVYDLAKPPHLQMGRPGGIFLKFDAMFPGKAVESNLEDTWRSSCGYNLFFIARNGSWTQEIRWTQLPNVLAVANRVVRDGKPLNDPLLLKVSPEFPGLTPAEQEWNQPPPYEAKVSDSTST